MGKRRHFARCGGLPHGKTLTQLRADASGKDTVLSTLDGLAAGARRRVGESDQSVEQFDVPIMNESTFSFEALQAFNTGSKLGSEGKILECIPYFQKAIDLDPKFAMAQASLGTAYLTLGDTKKAGGYSKVAFDLSGGVSQLEKLYIRYNYHLMTLHDLDSTVSDCEEWTRSTHGTRHRGRLFHTSRFRLATILQPVKRPSMRCR